jgi:hypothetical protein
MSDAAVKYELNTLTDYSDEAILNEIRRVAAGFQGNRLTVLEFGKASRVGITTLRRRFGSWREALRQAGVGDELVPEPVKTITRSEVVEGIRAYIAANGDTPTLIQVAERLGVHRSTILHRVGRWPDLLKELRLSPTPLGKRYTDEECFENIISLWTHYGRQPSFGDLKTPPSRVGPKAYIGRWGGWRAALAAFIEYVNRPFETAASDTSTKNGQVEPSSQQAVPVEPRSIGLAMRYRVLVRDRFRCQICGRSPANSIGVELHIDHIVPWSKGGLNTEENLRALCVDCNLGKGDKNEPAIEP